MRKYNRRKSQHFSGKYEEQDAIYEYYIYSLWYDDGNDFDYDIYQLEEEGMDWFYDNLEIMKRDNTINEILGIDNDNKPSFVFLNYREPLYYNGEWW